MDRLLFRWAIGVSLTIVCVSCSAEEWIPPVAGLMPGPRAQCGPKSLYAAARLLGKDVRYQNVLDGSRISAAGTSLAALREAAEGMGLSAFPVSANRAGLCSLLTDADQRLIAICQQKTREGNNHFVVWYPESSGKFCLLDWINPASRNMTERGLTHYTGAALLISDQTIDAATVAQLSAIQSRRRAIQWGSLGLGLVAGIVLGWGLNRTGFAARDFKTVPQACAVRSGVELPGSTGI